MLQYREPGNLAKLQCVPSVQEQNEPAKGGFFLLPLESQTACYKTAAPAQAYVTFDINPHAYTPSRLPTGAFKNTYMSFSFAYNYHTALPLHIATCLFPFSILQPLEGNPWLP